MSLFSLAKPDAPAFRSKTMVNYPRDTTRIEDARWAHWELVRRRQETDAQRFALLTLNPSCSIQQRKEREPPARGVNTSSPRLRLAVRFRSNMRNRARGLCWFAAKSRAEP